MCMIRNPYLFGGFRSHKIMFHLSLLLYVGSGDHLFVHVCKLMFRKMSSFLVVDFNKIQQCYVA